MDLPDGYQVYIKDKLDEAEVTKFGKKKWQRRMRRSVEGMRHPAEGGDAEGQEEEKMANNNQAWAVSVRGGTPRVDPDRAISRQLRTKGHLRCKSRICLEFPSFPSGPNIGTDQQISSEENMEK